jgi:hypothetical protein
VPSVPRDDRDQARHAHELEGLDSAPATGDRTPSGGLLELGELPAHGVARVRGDRPLQPAVSGAGAGPLGPDPSGLVSEGRMDADPDGVGWSLRDDECPLEGALSFDRTTGQVAWRPTCKNARCRRCSRQVSAQTFALARRAVDQAGEVVPGLPIRRQQQVDRVRFITLTRAPEGWQATRDAMRRWLERLRRDGYTMHVLWVVEKGSDTGMKHVHVIQWGDFIPKEVLSASWPHGTTQIEAARAAVDYLAKGVLRYVAKGIDGDPESVEDHMNLNGGRAAHWSREFFAGEGRNAFRQSNPLPGVYFVEVAR